MHYEERVERRRRRRHSAQFKAEAIAACRKPGASIAAAALERSINANLLRRWVLEAERGDGHRQNKKAPPIEGSTFLALPVPARAVDDPLIQMEVRRGALSVSVQWPASAMPQCALWLRELLK
jgi:transposase